MTDEIWKPINGFEGLYEISNRGRVKSLPRVILDCNGNRTRHLTGRILTNVCAQTGYHFVSLHKNDKRQTRLTVHRILMKTFDPRPDMDNLIVDHINGIRSDNRIENLRWTTFNTNNRNTPYIRYLQSVLKENNITYIDEENFES